MTKKLLLIFCSILFAFAAEAKIWEITDDTQKDQLRTTLGKIAAGDTIAFDNGEYYESNNGYISFNQNVVLMAMADAEPIIRPRVQAQITNNARVEIIGIKFNADSLRKLADWYNAIFVFADNNNNSLTLKDCELYNSPNYCIYAASGKKFTSCIIENCSIYNNAREVVKLESNSLGYMRIDGSTFTNHTASPVISCYSESRIDSCIINNCSFQNNTKGIVQWNSKNPGYLRVNGCEITGTTESAISGENTARIDSCIINNCYFHDNERCAIYFPNSAIANEQTCSKLIVTNSTFANINVSPEGRSDYNASVIDVLSYNYANADTGEIKVRVNHCTFYNNKTLNTDYSAIRVRISKDVIISNCIFAQDTSYERRATCAFAGEVTNCLSYNLTKDPSQHCHRQEHSKPTLTNNHTGDPLFLDAANGDYTLRGGSAALTNLGTDGKPLGDPRWWPVTVGAGGWSTYAAPYKYTVSGADVYKAACEGSTVVLTKVVDAVVPAGEGIALKGNVGDSIRFTRTDADASDFSGNELIGVTSPLAAPANTYVLATRTISEASVTAFFRCQAGVTIPAHKAYLNIPSGVSQAPIRIVNGENNATDLSNFSNSSNLSEPTKFFRNGVIYILRDGITYDVMGRIVK